MDQLSPTKRILSDVDAAEFVGRSAEAHQLLAHYRGETVAKGLTVLAPPGAGSSELLRQVYDTLFSSQNDVIPFYYRVRAGDVSIQAAAIRFLHEFLAQTVAFRLQDARIVESSPELAEILQISPPDDRPWIENLIESSQADRQIDDLRSFVRHCLSAPLRAAAGGAPVFVLIDDLHEAPLLDSSDELLDDMTSVFERSSIPVVFCGHRRFLYGRTSFPVLRMEQISFAEAGKLIQQTAARLGVPINDQTRDLIAVQLGCSPLYVRSLFASAYGAGTKLLSFAATEQLYTDELFGGRIARQFDRVLDGIAMDPGLQSAIIRLLSQTKENERNRTSHTSWKERLDLDDDEFKMLLEALHHNEIINLDAGDVIFDEADTVLGDYVACRSSLEANGGARARTVGAWTAYNVKRAPQLMARFYRKNSSLGLIKLVRAFDGRPVSPLLLDYSRFQAELKGAPQDRVLKVIREDSASIVLPQVVFAAYTSAYYPQFNEICETERSVTAIGVVDGEQESEVAWLASEVDSKLEAGREMTEFWCDRLEMVAANCNFKNYRIWLIAPEGFAPDAIDVLNRRGGIGSSRAQADLLSDLLLDKTAEPETAAHIYEFVVPMGDETEMIAAHTVEEIAKRHNFPVKAINQIKTALVEACINATEHSLSPDRKIYQTFSVDDERLTITVANRGVRLKDRSPRPIPNEGRRGWGLKLIKGLMDEVQIDNTDDGTRITMIKYIRQDH